jgi:hypothetical protein
MRTVVVKELAASALTAKLARQKIHRDQKSLDQGLRHNYYPPDGVTDEDAGFAKTCRHVLLFFNNRCNGNVW